MRRGSGLSGILIAAITVIIVFGVFSLYRGMIGYLESGGDITAPITATAVNIRVGTATSQALDTIIAPLAFSLPTTTPVRECLEFRVTVVKARIRACAQNTCDTVEQVPQDTVVCVYAPAAENAEWYEINIDPQEPLTRIGFMHESVIEAVNPTPKPSRTPLPTVTVPPTRTPRPTLAPTITPTIEPSRTPVPSPTVPLPTPYPPSATPRPSDYRA